MTYLISPGGEAVKVDKAEWFYRINQHGNVMTGTKIRRFTPATRTCSIDLDPPRGYVRATVNGRTIEYQAVPSQSAGRTLAELLRQLG